MQSGIKASSELKSAFTILLSDPSQFALVATIQNESLVPSETITSSSAGFPSDLSLLTPKLRPDAALYLLIRHSASGPAPLVCITYTPDSAPVRQKMLFASTRLTLARELGTEHFSEQIFCTTAEEVSPAGWERHVKHSALEAPLTEEEREGRKLRDDEASGGIAETGRREGHYVSGGEAGTTGATATAGAGADIPVKTGTGVVKALEGLRGARAGELVVLKLDIAAGEVVELDTTNSGIAAGELAGRISGQDPRYSFYTLDTGEGVKTLFIYTCPSGSKVKERMVYASSRNTVVKLAEAKVGLKLDKRLEGSDPEDFSADVLAGEFAQQVEEKKAFARPKRPGRR